MTGAALYRGHVVHIRRGPVRNRFRYPVYMWLVDLDHLPALPFWARPLGTLRSGDHLGDPGRSIRENVDAFLALHGIDLGGGRVRMLTNARVLGYVFNPLTVYWCHDGGGLRCVVAEVHNTYGERHCYLLEPATDGRATAEKAFYVSPFFTLDGRYTMRFSEPGERLTVTLELTQEAERVFAAALTGRRVPLTTRTLVAAAMRRPLMPQQVSALIRLQGVKLWLRGVPRVRRPRHRPQEGVR